MLGKLSPSFQTLIPQAGVKCKGKTYKKQWLNWILRHICYTDWYIICYTEIDQFNELCSSCSRQLILL